MVFFCLSILFIYPFIRCHVIFSAGDLPYHINRIQELTDNLKNGVWYPYLYTHHFKNTAYLLGAFYPQLTLLPYAVASILLKNDVNGVYVGMAFYSFLSMLNMYIVMRKIKRSTIQSILVAVVYCFSTYRTINAFSRFALGEYIGMTFIPLALYGLYSIIYGNKRDWPYLALGLSFTLLSHVLSTLLCVSLLLVIFVAYIKDIINKKTIKYLFMAVIAFLCSSAIFIVPFLEQETFKNYNQPSPTYLSEFTTTLSNLLLNSFSNIISVKQVSNWWEVANIGFILLISMLWGLFNYNKLDSFDKFFEISGGILFLMSSSIFPWTIVMATPLKVMQFPFRLLELSTILLSPLFGTMIVNIFSKYKVEVKSKVLILLLSILIVIIPWYSSATTFTYLHQNQKENFINGKIYSSDSKDMTYWWLDQYTPQMDKKSFDNIIDNNAIVNGKNIKLDKFKAIPNGIIIYDKDIRNKGRVVLPVASYRNIHIYQNKQNILTSNKKNSLLTVNNVINYPLIIKYVPSLLDNISMVVSIVTWMLLIALILRKDLLHIR